MNRDLHMGHRHPLDKLGVGVGKRERWGRGGEEERREREGERRKLAVSNWFSFTSPLHAGPYVFSGQQTVHRGERRGEERRGEERRGEERRGEERGRRGEERRGEEKRGEGEGRGGEGEERVNHS